MISLKNALQSVALVVSVLAGSMSASAQCQYEWNATSGAPGLAGNGAITNMIRYNSPDGPMLFACGEGASSIMGAVTASGVVYTRDAVRWNPLHIPAMASDASLTNMAGMQCMCTYDPDGQGPIQETLYLAGTDQSMGNTLAVFSYDGTQVRKLASMNPFAGSRSGIRQLLMFQRSQEHEAELYVCGSFNGSVGIGVLRNGTVQSLGGPGNRGEAMLVHDDGSGSKLYVAAHHSFGGQGYAGPDVINIGTYDGFAWHSVGGGLPGANPIAGLIEFDHDGLASTRPVLAAICVDGVRYWDGTSWSPLIPIPGAFDYKNNYLSGSVALYNDGTGPALYMGAGYPRENIGSQPYLPKLFKHPVGAGSIAALDDSSGSFFTRAQLEYNPKGVYVSVQDLGVGEQLIASGSFAVRDDLLGNTRLHAWTRQGWADAGSHAQHRPLDIYDMAVHDPDGDGPLPAKLYVCGKPSRSLGESTDELEEVGSVGVWDGATWEYAGAGLAYTTAQGRRASFVYSLASGMLNGTPTLFASASVDASNSLGYVYAFNGSTWEPLDPETFVFPGSVRVIATSIQGSHELFAYGTIGVLRWNGETWVDPDPTNPVPGGLVYATVFNEGTGNSLVVSTNGQIQKWDGEGWTVLESGLQVPTQGAYQVAAIGSDLIAFDPFLTGFGVGRPIFKWSSNTWVDTTASLPSGAYFAGVLSLASGHRAYFYDPYSKGTYSLVDILSYAPGDSSVAIDQSIGGVSYLINPGPELTTEEPVGHVRGMVRYSVNGEDRLCVGGLFNGAGSIVDASHQVGITVSSVPGTGFAFMSCVNSTCIADFDRSGAVAVDDIFVYLDAWFGLQPRADINHTQGITVDDIFLFLESWFVGCN